MDQNAIIDSMPWEKNLKERAKWVAKARKERELPDMDVAGWQKWSLPYGGGAGV